MTRKYTLLLFIFFTCSLVAQDIPRGVLGGLIFENLFGQSYNVNNHPIVDYPNPYVDLQDDIELFKKIKIVSYLDYGDGQSAFGTGIQTTAFFPYENITRGEALIAIIEAWNVPTYWTGSSTFNDVTTSSAFFGYVEAAVDIGFINTSQNNFNPYDLIDSSDLVIWMSGILNSQYHPVSNSTLFNANNYFLPNNYQPDTIGYLRGIEQGVFSHYAKNSFVIPDRKFNLNFSHYYSTQLVELPETYFPIEPLGRGWTHTYNAYITREENVLGNDDLYYIKWSDGSIDIYNDNENEYITQGVYDELDEQSSGDIVVITKKNQTKYYFEKLDNSEPVFYLIQIVDSNANTVNIEYETSDVDNDFERIKWVEAPSGKKLRFYYHSNTDFIEYIEDPINRQIHFDYNEERLKYFYDAKNQETKYYYVSNDEDAPEQHQYKRFLLRKVRLPENNTIEAEYDDDDNGKLKEYTINDNATTYVDVSYNYGNNSPMIAHLEVPMPNGSMQDYNYQFDANNGMVTDFQNDTQDINITYPDPTDINPLLPTNIDVNGLDIDYEYDDKGNVTEIQKEGITDEDFDYDNDNNLIHYQDANGNDTFFNYNSNNNLTSIEDALGNYIYLNYDSYGQITSVTNQEGITVNYTYEDDGAVSTINAPENLTSSFTYDGVNRLLSQTINGQTSSISYDPNDNITSQTNIGGLTTTFNYDANDNLVTITNANGIDTVFTYNDKDQLVSESFNGLTKQYEYNNDGTLDKYTKPSGAIIEYDYLSNGNFNDAGTIADVDYFGSSDGKREGLIESIASDDIRYNFDYDPLNRLDIVEIDNEPNNTVGYNYDDVGNLTRIYYPDSPSNFYVRYYYDAKNRLDEIRITANGNTQSVITYEYYNDDRIHKVWYPNDIEARYTYDNAGRLIRINHIRHYQNGGNDSYFIQDIEFDNRGNILSDNSLYREQIENEEDQNFNLQDETYAYNSTNHITQAGSEAITVNNDGNTTQKGNINYQYNIDDQLINITGNNGETNINFHLKYDAYGNRVQKNIVQNVETRRYVWDIINNNVIKEYNPTGSEQYFYVYGASGLEFSVSPTTGNIISFYHGDIRGSVVYRSDTNGDVIANHFNKYDDFGNVTTYNNANAEAFGSFTYLGKHGIVNDVTTQDGLYYIKARYYDAKLGRFLTQDPIWSTNLYPYSNNNPITNTDINGKYWESAIDAAFLAHSYYEWEKDPSLLNSAALAFDGIGTALPFVAGLGTGLKTGIIGVKNSNKISQLGRGVNVNWGKVQYYKDGGYQSLIEHIMARHSYYSSALKAGKFSKETTGKALKSYVNQALKYGSEIEKGVFQYTFNHSIGINRNGINSKTINVIINNGVVRTAFPF